jgi:hypothetical protein
MTGVHVVVCVAVSTVQGDGCSSVAVAWTIVSPFDVPLDMLLIRQPFNMAAPATTTPINAMRLSESIMRFPRDPDRGTRSECDFGVRNVRRSPRG